MGLAVVRLLVCLVAIGAVTMSAGPVLISIMQM